MVKNQKFERERVNSIPTTGLVAGTRYDLNVGGGKYKTVIISNDLQPIVEAGAEFIEKDTMAQLRAISSREIWAIQNGYYKGVRLNGYYTEGDTHRSIDYYLSDTTENDDGGSVIQVGSLKFEHKFKNEINILYFGAKGDGTTDNSVNVQNAINYTNVITDLSHLFGFIIFFPKGDYIIRNIKVKKPSYIFKGEGNRASRLLGDTELTLTIQPLWGNNPFPNSGFGGFFLQDIGLYANNELARNEGIGIKMINCFVTDFTNFYVSGFKKNIQLNGCHFNKFNNFYSADEKVSEVNPNEEIFNRGYAISVSNDPASTEKGATSLHISSGWMHNTSLDLEYLENGIIENIDIEPASNSVIVGKNQTWRNNRFERMDYYSAYANPPKYPEFNWFVIKGSDNNFYDNDVHDLGARSVPFVNAKFKVEGDNNSLIFNRRFIHFGFLDFSPESKGNILELGRYRDEELFAETTSKNFNMERIDGMHEGINTIILNELNSYIKISGRKEKQIIHCSSIMSKMNSTAFIQGATKVGNKYTITEDSNNRIIMNFGTTNNYEPGVYCLLFRLKSNIENGIFRVLSNYTNTSYGGIKSSNKDGIYAFRFSILPSDQLIMPAIYFDRGFNSGDEFELSEIELLKMDDGQYTEAFYNIADS